MPYKLLVSVNSALAKKNVLPLDMQNIGNIKPEEMELIRRQREAAKKLDAEAAKKEGREVNPVEEDPQKVALEQMDKVVDSNKKLQFFNYKMLSDRAQELRKATNRMQGRPDDQDYYHANVTSRQLDVLMYVFPGLWGYAATEQERAEVAALEAEYKRLDDEFVDWYGKTTIHISTDNNLDTSSYTSGNYIPKTLGDKIEALYTKISAQIQKQKERLDREHPAAAGDHRPDTYDMERKTYDSIQRFVNSVGNATRFYEKFDKNPYFRAQMQAQNGGGNLLSGDRQKITSSRAEVTPEKEQEYERGRVAGELLPVKEYFEQMAKVSTLNDELNATYRTAVKAEQDAKAISKDPKVISEKIKPFTDAYREKLGTFIKESAKLDGFYDKIKVNAELLSSQKLGGVFNVSGLAREIDDINELTEDRSLHRFGVSEKLIRAQETHERFQKMILNGWTPDQANFIASFQDYLNTLLENWKDQGYTPVDRRGDAPLKLNDDSVQGSSIDTYIYKIKDDVARLAVTNPGSGEGMSERVEAIRDNLNRLMEDLGTMTLGPDDLELRADDIRIFKVEMDNVFDHEGGLVEDAIFKDDSAGKLRASELAGNKYTAAEQRADIEYVKANIPGFNVVPEALLKDEGKPEKEPEAKEEDIAPDRNINQQGVHNEADDLNIGEGEPNLQDNNQDNHQGDQEDNLEDDLEENLRIDDVAEELEVKAAKMETAKILAEAAELANEQIDKYIQEHPFENAAWGIEDPAHRSMVVRYNATQNLMKDPEVQADNKLMNGLLDVATADLGVMKNTTAANGKPLDEVYAEVHVRMEEKPVYVQWDKLFAQNLQKAEEQFGDLGDMSPEHKRMLLSARAIELTGREMIKSGNLADRELFERADLELQGRMNRERMEDGSRLSSKFRELAGAADQKIAEEQRRLEEERLAREAEERRIREAEERRQREKETRKKVADSFKEGPEEVKPAKKRVTHSDIVPAGRRDVKYSAPSSEIEKLNSLDINRLSFYVKDVMPRIGNLLSENEKKEIISKVDKLQDRMRWEYSDLEPRKGTGMASNTDWRILPAELASDVKEIRGICAKLQEKLDEHLQSEPDPLKRDPIAVFYSDYLRHVKNGRSYYSVVQGDGLYERVLMNALGAITVNPNSFDFEKLRKDIKDFPLLQAVSKANAMHRLMEDESFAIDSGNGVEMTDEMKVLAMAKSLKKDLEAMNAYDDAEYKKNFEDTEIFQHNQRGNLKLGPGRGMQKAYRECDERIQALEHKWLVRDLPMISRLGDLSEFMTLKMEQEGKKIPDDQKKTMQDFIDFYKESILKNPAPMTETLRQDLMSRATEKLNSITYPPVVTGLKLGSEGQEITNSNMKTGDRALAAAASATAAIIQKTASRELSESEKQRMLMSDGTVISLLGAMEDRWQNMPKEPFWHKKNTPEDPFGRMQDAWEKLMIAVKADGGDHPEHSFDVKAAAEKLKKACDDYIAAKNDQKSLDTKKMNIKELRAANKSKRSEYGQYRYELAESLKTMSGVLIAAQENPRALELTAPYVEKPAKQLKADEINIENVASKYDLTTGSKKQVKTKNGTVKAAGKKAKEVGDKPAKAPEKAPGRN